jgi:proline iminopeptidase
MVEFLTVNGATLAYAITGPTSAPLMITLHGGRGMGTYPPPHLSNRPSDSQK